MKRLDKMKQALLAGMTCVCGAVLLFGCTTPGKGGNSGRTKPVRVTYTPPEPDGYYTGRKPDFTRAVPRDPLGRKYRVEYLQVDFHNWDRATDRGQTAREGMAGGFARAFLMVREQSANAPGGIREAKGDRAFGEAKNLCNYLFSISDALLEKIGNAATSSETDRKFLKSYWHDTAALNRELEKRFPGLFSTAPDAFPLDVMLGYLAETHSGERHESLYEAWILGLPEHACITELDPDGGTDSPLPSEEAFVDPLDAIAAALFKLTPEQWRGLESANPNDHVWRK